MLEENKAAQVAKRFLANILEPKLPRKWGFTPSENINGVYHLGLCCTPFRLAVLFLFSAMYQHTKVAFVVEYPAQLTSWAVGLLPYIGGRKNRLSLIKPNFSQPT